jgi:hypothetical protein
VFLVDVDNTLIDNDRIAADLKRHVAPEVGRERQERYFSGAEKSAGQRGNAGRPRRALGKRPSV